MGQNDTLRSEYVYRGRVVTLRIDTCRTASGREVLREVVEHRGAVAIVPMLDAQTVVMVRQYRQAVGEPLLEVPAGTLDIGEDPVACAAREIEEEIGYRAGRLTPMFRQYIAPGYSSEELHTYLAEELQVVGARPDDDEDIEVIPVPIRDVVQMIIDGAICDAKSIAALLVALHRPVPP
ncbi:MAG TPA: NUDIX hydrolase [Chthonomonadales bacterium]|nr:NUDIX hydrolase [Chthonomonadales bacterium]